jgi:hypothetical protein
MIVALSTLNLRLHALGEVNFTDAGSKAVAAANVYSGGIVNDPIGSVTWTTGIRLAGCRAKDVSIDIGVHKVLTPS